MVEDFQGNLQPASNIKLQQTPMIKQDLIAFDLDMDKDNNQGDGDENRPIDLEEFAQRRANQREYRNIKDLKNLLKGRDKFTTREEARRHRN